MTSNPYLQGPPVISLPALIVDFTQKGLGQVMQERLPPLTIPKPVLPTIPQTTVNTDSTSLPTNNTIIGGDTTGTPKIKRTMSPGGS